MTKTELLEQFDKENQGTYTLDDLALLIVEAFRLGEESEQEAIQRVRELHFNNEEWTACDMCDKPYPCLTIKALDGEQ